MLFLIAALFPMPLHAVATDNVSPSRMAQAIAGRWTVVKNVQSAFDEISSRPNSQGGEIEEFQVKIVEAVDFWGDRPVQEVEHSIKTLAAESKHDIVATGFFEASVAEKPLAGFGGLFLLTQKGGESFLSVLNVDGAKFMPWRIHHVPGKTREKDLLIVEFGEYLHSRQVTIFQFNGGLVSDSASAENGDTE